MSVNLRGRMTLGGQLGSSNGTAWITEPFWKASVRYQAVTGEVLYRMIPGAQIF